jgi:hypothetical protein
LKKARRIPEDASVMDDRLEPSYEELSISERECVLELLFNDGRMDGAFRREQRTLLKSLPIFERRIRFFRTYETPHDQGRVDRLLARRRAAKKEIKGFVVKDWEPTIRYISPVIMEDGECLLKDNRW